MVRKIVELFIEVQTMSLPIEGMYDLACELEVVVFYLTWTFASLGYLTRLASLDQLDGSSCVSFEIFFQSHIGLCELTREL
ncbi:hypothetical protein L6452_04139 [Arctium lappa]|uniref:Uncharacterized protein n=1 Tax=Arctium lappa TaxID=4217 RepID=A0ACB9FNL0_ARCLA|nr:hypothetical protein L6452_04139 [Arctium lappa]